METAPYGRGSVTALISQGSRTWNGHAFTALGEYNFFMPDHDVPRRAFLRGVTAATAFSYSRVMGANDRVQLGSDRLRRARPRRHG